MNDLFEMYTNHKSHYEVFDFTKEKIAPYIKDLKRHRVRSGHIEWLALKWAGNFFAYDRQIVWLFLANNKTKSNVKMRYKSPGFYVSITTADDAALYGDWKTPLDDETMAKVIQYFDKLPVLKNYKTTCKELNQIIGCPGIFSNS